MKIFVIIGHQKKGSFCHAIAETAMAELKKAGHDVIFHDLYNEGFNPILAHEEIPKDAPLDPVIERHCKEITQADGYIVIHPNWWAQAPAILKGWLDRVLRQGVAYEFGADGTINGFFKEKTAVVFTTSNTPRDIELKVYGDPLENFWKTCVFGFCGVEKFFRRNFESVIMSTLEERQGWLKFVQETVKEYFPSK